jgi:hypothetical protein
MTADPRAIAAVLRVDESVVRRLQARGYLQSFALTHVEVRLRLFRVFSSTQREDSGGGGA